MLLITSILLFVSGLLCYFIFKNKKQKKIEKIYTVLNEMLVVSRAGKILIIKSDVRPGKDVNFEIKFFASRNSDEKIRLKFRDIKIDNVTANVLQSVKDEKAAFVEVDSFPEGEIKQSLLDRNSEYFEMHFLKEDAGIFYMCSIESGEKSNRFKDLLKRKAIDNGINILRAIL